MSGNKLVFGLIKKTDSVTPAIKPASLFDCSDDDDVDVNKPSASVYKKPDVPVVQEEIFDYDGFVEERNTQRVEDAKRRFGNEEARKSKHMEKFKESARRRHLTNSIAEDKKIEREREAEIAIYGVKDVFVTASYRKQLEEKKILIKEEEVRKLEEEKYHKAQLAKNTFSQPYFINRLNPVKKDEVVPQKIEFRNVKDKLVANERKRLHQEDDEEEEMRPKIKPKLNTNIGGLHIMKEKPVIKESESVSDVVVPTIDEDKQEEPLSKIEEVVVKKPKKFDVRTLSSKERLKNIAKILAPRNSPEEIEVIKKRFHLRKLREEICPPF
uniref:DUF2040 domain-containing protein n=1 Tax=Rhabditophanes sp. KR3021 TaxID=114890 RepID=A0AC35TLY5_9BILA